MSSLTSQPKNPTARGILNYVALQRKFCVATRRQAKSSSDRRQCMPCVKPPGSSHRQLFVFRNDGFLSHQYSRTILGQEVEGKRETNLQTTAVKYTAASKIKS